MIKYLKVKNLVRTLQVLKALMKSIKKQPQICSKCCFE